MIHGRFVGQLFLQLQPAVRNSLSVHAKKVAPVDASASVWGFCAQHYVVAHVNSRCRALLQ